MEENKNLTKIIFTALFDKDSVELYSNSNPIERELLVLSTDHRIGLALEKTINSTGLEKTKWFLRCSNKVYALDSVDFYEYAYVSKIGSILEFNYSDRPVLFK